jgi:hypothetical protein
MGSGGGMQQTFSALERRDSDMRADRFVAALMSDAGSSDDSTYALFDPFIGSWRFDLFHYDAGKEFLAGRGEWHFSRILDGRAVQDVWECHTVTQPPRLVERGTTMRMYDKHRGNWRIVFFSPLRGYVDTLAAEQVGAEIVLQGIGRSGRPCLWIFAAIANDSFEWREEETPDHGKTWTRLELMRLTRNT